MPPSFLRDRAHLASGALILIGAAGTLVGWMPGLLSLLIGIAVRRRTDIARKVAVLVSFIHVLYFAGLIGYCLHAASLNRPMPLATLTAGWRPPILPLAAIAIVPYALAVFLLTRPDVRDTFTRTLPPP